MADEDESGQEKTEDPTGRRLSKAREEGQVPRSRELNTAAVLIAGAVSLLIFGGMVSDRLMSIARQSFQFSRTHAMDSSLMVNALGTAAGQSMLSLVPAFIALLLAAVITPNLLGGWNFATKTLVPNLKKLDPIAGMKKIFSVRGLVEMLKAIAKILVVGAVGILIIWSMQSDILNMGREALWPAVDHALTVITWSALALAVSTLLIAAVDIPYQMYDHKKKLKMTKQQVKEEMKNVEGDPQVKGRIRQAQMQAAMRRMMAEVPKADVVITNPTHFAVALRYDVSKSGAPMLVAKGADQLAFKIREIAAANDVPVVSSPKLARAIYHTTELDMEIPSGLYLAVAQVLAYVFHLKNFKARRAQRPTLPTDLPIPPGMDPLETVH